MEKLLKPNELNKFFINLIKEKRIPNSINIESFNKEEIDKLYNLFPKHNIYGLDLNNKKFNNFYNTPMYYKECFVGEILDNYFNNPAFSYDACIGYSELSVIVFDKIINNMNMNENFRFSKTGTAVFLNDLNESVLLSLNDSLKKNNLNGEVKNLFKTNLKDIKPALMMKEINGKYLKIKQNTLEYDLENLKNEIDENTVMLVYEPLKEDFYDEFKKIVDLKKQKGDKFTLFLNLKNFSSYFLNENYNKNFEEISKECDYIFTDFSRLVGHWSNILFVKNKDSYVSNMYIEEQKYMIKNHEEGILYNEYNAKDYMVGFGHKSSIITLSIFFDLYDKKEINDYLSLLMNETMKAEKILKEKNLKYYRIYNNLVIDEQEKIKMESVENNKILFNDKEYFLINIKDKFEDQELTDYLKKFSH